MQTRFAGRHFPPVCARRLTVRGAHFRLPATFVEHLALHPACVVCTTFESRYLPRACARRPVLRDASFPPLPICPGIQRRQPGHVAHSTLADHHFPRICAVQPTPREIPSPLRPNCAQLHTSNPNSSACKASKGGLRLKSYAVLKGPRSRQDTLPLSFLPAACDRRRGTGKWPHQGAPAKEVFAAWRELLVPGFPPPSASHWPRPPRQH